MSEETFAFTEEEMKRLEKASDEWNICREKTGQIWEGFFDDDEYDDTDDDLIPYRQYLIRRWIIIYKDKYIDSDKQALNELLTQERIDEKVFNAVTRKLTGRDSSYIDDLAEMLSRRLNRIMGEVLYEGKKVPAYRILTMNSSRKTPTLLTRENCQFFDLLLRKDDEEAFSEFAKRIEGDDPREFDDFPVKCLVETGIKSLAKNEHLNYTDDMIQGCLLRIFSNDISGERATENMENALKYVSNTVAHYKMTYPHNLEHNKEIYREITGCLMDCEHMIFTLGEKMLRK